MTDALRANFGLRYSLDEKSATRTLVFTDLNGNPLTGVQEAVVAALNLAVLNRIPHSLQGSLSEDHLLPSVGLQYNFSPQIMTYATWTLGAKSGGFDATSTRPPSAGGTFQFAPEHADAYEVGAKMEFGERFELNPSVYYTNYRDLQVSTFDGVGFEVSNAGAATIKGAQLTSRWAATPNLRFNLAVAYTDFRFTEYIGQCITGQTPTEPGPGGKIVDCNLAGTTNQGIAPWVETLTGDYRIPLGRLEMHTTVDAYHTSSFYASTVADPRQVQDAYTKLDARLSLGDRAGHWQLALLGQNLTNALIMPLGADVPLSYTLSHAFTAFRVVEPGRSYTVQADWRF
jgi:outer membrane receptor protein involved in Fe transport